MVGGEVAHFNTYNRSKKTEGGECGGTLTIWLWVTWNTIKNNLSSNLKACNWPLIQKTLLILQCTNMAWRQYDISINKHAHLLAIQVWSLDPTNIHLLTTQMKSQHVNSPFLSTLHFLPKIPARMGKVESTYARSLFLLSIASLQKCTYQVP